MPGDREQIYQASYDAFVAGDADRLAELSDPEVRIVSRLGAVEGREYGGPEGVREWVEDFRGQMGAFTVEPATPPVMVTQGDRSIVTGAWRLRGAGSGVEIYDRWYMVIDWRGDLVWRVHVFNSADEAQEFAGFAPPPAED